MQTPDRVLIGRTGKHELNRELRDDVQNIIYKCNVNAELLYYLSNL